LFLFATFNPTVDEPDCPVAVINGEVFYTVLGHSLAGEMLDSRSRGVALYGRCYALSERARSAITGRVEKSIARQCFFNTALERGHDTDSVYRPLSANKIRSEGHSVSL